MKNILVISPHPDDETLGCGGTLIKHQGHGERLYWLILTTGYEPRWSSDLIERAAIQVKKVSQAYHMEQFFSLGLPSTRLDVTPQNEIIDNIRKIVITVRPQVVYVAHDGDVHTDHHFAFTATLSVLKSFYMQKFGIQRILCYETLSSTEAAPPQFHRSFIPNIYNDISGYLERKIEIMGMYETEEQATLMPRGASAIRALARFRGASVGVEYAEAFMLVREVSYL
jgi:LmbE family N-acetylglucosaminyl deacetylase